MENKRCLKFETSNQSNMQKKLPWGNTTWAGKSGGINRYGSVSIQRVSSLPTSTHGGSGDGFSDRLQRPNSSLANGDGEPGETWRTANGAHILLQTSLGEYWTWIEKIWQSKSKCTLVSHQSNPLPFCIPSPTLEAQGSNIASQS
jgi:hypothetical protein